MITLFGYAHFFNFVSFLCTSHLHPRPRGAGNSGDIDFSICKAQVKSLHCRDFVLVKSRPGHLS